MAKFNRVLAIIIFISILVFAQFWAWGAAPAWAAAVTVDTTSDVSDGDVSSISNLIANPGADGVISLREAIQAANNTAGEDTIGFNIPGCGGVCAIQPLTPLPALSGGGTTIDGYTQPGAAPATETTLAILLIELDVSQVTEFSGDGILITSANNVVQGLVINRYGLNANGATSGIEIIGEGAFNNIVAGNYIGTDPSGTSGTSSEGCSVILSPDTHDNLIGGDSPGERNILSANNVYGVKLDGVGVDGNTVSGNYIGADATGTADLGNRLEGVYIGASASGNTIGGDTLGERNIISGNNQMGIWLRGSTNYHPTDNVIIGNYIGLDVTGAARLANTGEGVTIWNAQDNFIMYNVISGNGDEGIYLSANDADLTGNVIVGNLIGTDATGTVEMRNLEDGISIYSSDGYQARDNLIGGVVVGAGNLIATNSRNGIFLEGSGTQNNIIAGNLIAANRYNGIIFTDGPKNNIVSPSNSIVYNQTGVLVSGSTTTGNIISQSNIYGNFTMAIELKYDANGGIQPPEINNATETEPITVTGTACPGCTVELFANTDDDSEGEEYLGAVVADGGGDFTMQVTGLELPYLTATATDPVDGTSQFSLPYKTHIEIEQFFYLPLIANDN
jgi:parallel beta-helix repeat protein